MNKWLLNCTIESNQQSVHRSAYVIKFYKKCWFFYNKIKDLQQRFLNMSLKLELF